MRLIDADAMKEHVKRFTSVFAKYDWREICEMLNDAPTVDAVPVVRCKDCIHKPRGTRNKYDMEFPDEICPCQCDDYWYSWMPYDDWFCANGERREDETN